MSVTFHPLPTHFVRALQAGQPDCYGNAPEPKTYGGDGVPCRHCLRYVADCLVLAYRPFETLQAYAETGPIFLCADGCEQAAVSTQLPAILSSPTHIIRGYDTAECIIYGTGIVVPTETIIQRAEAMFADSNVDFIHVRSASNNCYLCRIERTDAG